MACSRTITLRWAALGLALLGMSVAGSIYSFTAYAIAIKKTFNYTQTEVEWIASFSNFGSCIGTPAGFLAQRYGARGTCVVGFVLSVLGYMMAFQTTFAVEFYRNKAALQCFYYFTGGFGTAFTYMAGLNCCVRNFSPVHRGKVIGSLETFYNIGPAVGATIYATLFVNGHQTDEENQDLRGFLLLLSIAMAVANGFGVIFWGRYPYKKENETTAAAKQETPQIPATGDVEEEKDSKLSAVADIGIPQIFKLGDFWLSTVPYILCVSLQVMYQTNITSYLKAFHREDLNAAFTIAGPVANTVANLVSSLLSDWLMHRCSRVIFLIVEISVQTIALIAFIFEGDNVVVLYFSIFALSMPVGVTWSLTPTIISEYFGIKNFDVTWGTMMIGSAVMGTVLHYVFGILYEREIPEGGGHDCFGLHCFTYSTIIVAVLSGFSLVCYIVLWWRRRRLEQHIRQLNLSSFRLEKNGTESVAGLSFTATSSSD